MPTISPPRNGRISELILDGESVRGFSNDFNQPDQGKLQNPVAGKGCLFFAGQEIDRLFGMIQHVPDSDGGIMLRHTALWLPIRFVRGNTCSKTRGCSDPLCVPRFG